MLFITTHVLHKSEMASRLTYYNNIQEILITIYLKIKKNLYIEFVPGDYLYHNTHALYSKMDEIYSPL